MGVAFASSTSDYAELASAPITTTPLTMACWFQKADVTTTSCLLGLTYHSGSEGFVLYAAGATGGDPVAATTLNNAGSDTAVSASGFTANTWYHAGGTWASAASRTAWIGGTAGSADTNSRTPITNPNRTTLGALRQNGTLTSFHNGWIAEAAIWNVVLDAAEMGALAKGVIPKLIRPASLVFYAPLLHSAGINLKGAPLSVVGTEAGFGPKLIYPTNRPLLDANASPYIPKSSYARIMG